MESNLHITYFPSIAHFIAIVNADKVVFEKYDHYQKQTYRNRTNIYGANGKLVLSIPIHYTQNNRQLYKDVRIANNSKWQTEHWKSLLSAYSTSPFFEFFKDELEVLFSEEETYLMEFNFKCLNVVLNCMQLDLKYQTSKTFEKQPRNCLDLRHLVNAKKGNSFTFDNYTQVFGPKYGFISNLSILDLLFNEGPNTLNYLKAQDVQQLRAGSL